MKPVILIILDGWGVAQSYIGNAITQAKTPVFNDLIANYPTMTLSASGEAVGLPWGEKGNSEVGHLNLGLGRIVYQHLPKINKIINNRDFYKNEILLKSIQHVKINQSSLHLLGLVSDGGVHSSIEHLKALLVLSKKHDIKQLYLHAILDGRDTAYNSGINFIQNIKNQMSKYKIGKIATISGRFYAMDRNNYWDRTAKAYLAMVNGVGRQSSDPIEAIKESYNKRIYDEEFRPTVIVENGQPVGKIQDKDSVIFFNFREDRARQLTKSFVLPGFEKFQNRKYFNNLFFACFTEYEKNLPIEIVFKEEDLRPTLGEVISKAGLSQLRIAETEKYAHVTYFFNGGREDKSLGEDHILIPSPQVDSYDLKPDMSALEITKTVVKFENNYDFILINFANADMVGHTGNIPAAIRAVETLDKCLKQIIQNVLDKDGVILITADHGNAENMFDMQTGMYNKEHTINPVPFIVVGKKFLGKTAGFSEIPGNDLSLLQPQGVLSDVAPTILKIMGIDQPKEMSGRNLIGKE